MAVSLIDVLDAIFGGRNGHSDQQVLNKAISQLDSSRGVHAQLVVGHAKCGENCERAIPVEVWSVLLERNEEARPMDALFLKNAIRSHMHFSQVASWISNEKNCEDDPISFFFRLVDSPLLLSPLDGSMELHSFPISHIGRGWHLRVSVKYIKRDALLRPDKCPPIGPISDQWSCSPPSPPIDLIGTKHKAVEVPLYSPNGPTEKRECVDKESAEKQTDGKVSVKDHELPIRINRISRLDGKPIFNKLTGLPLRSSPAPPKTRTQLPTKKERSSASESEAIDVPNQQQATRPEYSRSAPALGLLGSFEESALNGRLDTYGTLEGFTLQLAASGSIACPHVTLPVKTSCFDVEEESAPFPFLGRCPLDTLGKKGYRIPKKGILQATLFNTEHVVVRVFLVRYDLSDMPPNSQTFIRQKSYLMPKDAPDGAINKNNHMRYLIHLRIASGRSGRLFLHSDVRILFAHETASDALNIEISKGRATGDSGYFQLRTFTEQPSHPKYSSRK